MSLVHSRRIYALHSCDCQRVLSLAFVTSSENGRIASFSLNITGGLSDLKVSSGNFYLCHIILVKQVPKVSHKWREQKLNFKFQCTNSSIFVTAFSLIHLKKVFVPRHISQANNKRDRDRPSTKNKCRASWKNYIIYNYPTWLLFQIIIYVPVFSKEVDEHKVLL